MTALSLSQLFLLATMGMTALSLSQLFLLATMGKASVVGLRSDRRNDVKTTLTVSNHLRCWDSVTVPYKRIETSERPSSLDHARAICNTETMTLCTFLELVALFDSPVRDFVADWAFADFGTAEWREARVGWGCETSTETECYDGKISNTPIVESEVKAVHCCSNIIHSGGTLTKAADVAAVPRSTDVEIYNLPTLQPAAAPRKRNSSLGRSTYNISDTLKCSNGSTVYQRIESDQYVYAATDVDAVCNAYSMQPCVLSQMLTVFESPERNHKIYEWALTDWEEATLRKARVAYNCGDYQGEECYGGKVPNVHVTGNEVKAVHCCKDDLSCLLPTTTSPPPLSFSIWGQVECPDGSIPYKRVHGTPHPVSFADTQAFCENNRMSLCTLPDLAMIYDYPDRESFSWAFVDIGGLEKREAKVGKNGCEVWTGDECYAGKIPNTPRYNEKLENVHCCNHVANSCIVPTTTTTTVTPFSVVVGLVCQDTGITPYRQIRSHIVPQGFYECRRFCEENHMTLCTLDEMVMLYDYPLREDQLRLGFC